MYKDYVISCSDDAKVKALNNFISVISSQSRCIRIDDVEQGDPEVRDHLRPLLGHGPQREDRPRLPRLQFGSSESIQNQRDPFEPDETPSGASTVNNTPMGEVPESWPRKWRRSDRRLRRYNTELLEAIEDHNVEEVERLLKAGANPNATCRLGLVSACHLAALAGGESLALLLKFGAEKHRLDKLGRTPLHLAAWAGNVRQVAMLLGFPEDIQARVDVEAISPSAEADVKKLCPKVKELVNVRCKIEDVNTLLSNTWKDNIDHNCKDITGSIPLLQSGWTPLHVASAIARKYCTRLLLIAGADPNIEDEMGRTPLDVAGSAFYYDKAIQAEDFAEVISLLLKAGGRYNTMKVGGINNVDTPLHTAVEVESLDIINELLKAGASITCLNAAGQTPLHVCVKKELEEPLQILANYSTNDADPLAAMVDVKDRDGHTVLQAAVDAAWVPGVCIALEAGADVTLRANDGETPVHSAAALGNIDVLKEIISVSKQKDFIDCQNERGETPLFKAVTNGHLNCLKTLIDEGASMKIILPGDVNVFHIAAETGNYEILKELLEQDDAITNSMINSLTTENKRGFGPIHFAVYYEHTACVELLLSKNADIRLRTTSNPHKLSTPLHLAAKRNHLAIACLILKFDHTTIHEVNGLGWFPLHTATHHGSTEVITLLLREGADLSSYTGGPKKFRCTAIDMLINNFSNPTEFLENVFDSYIETNCRNIQDQSCEVTVDYRVLIPSKCEMKQMKVIQALLKTGNRYSQKRLLLHPLVESFLYLKWKALLPFFYTILIIYAIFVATLTIFSVSVFFYKDTKEIPPVWLKDCIWGYLLYVSIVLLVIQELLYMNVKSKRYLLQLETWIKFGSIGLASVLPLIVLIESLSQANWTRHVATLALLLAWMEMMFLLSRFPNWGYYVLMFGKVASNVIKILLTFAFLVVGFSLSFMIQFHSQMPFEGPFSALVKTMVMMTSEFDYVALFDEEHTRELATSIIIIRIIFVIFLVLASIVLMNLMVGVAVNDINNLEILGNIRRIEKQVEFLGTLDTLVYNKVFETILPKKVNKRIKDKKKVFRVLTLCPGKPRWRHLKMLPSRIRDAIFNKALQQKKQMEDELGIQMFKAKIDEMHKAMTEKNKQPKVCPIESNNEERPARNKMRHEEIMKHLNDLDGGMNEMNVHMSEFMNEFKLPLEELNFKLDQMSLEIGNIKMFLNKLESKNGSKNM